MDCHLIGTIKPNPTPTLTLPDTFIFNFLIISFILLKKMPFRWDMRFEKGGGKKHHTLPSTPLKTDAEWASFFVLTNLIILWWVDLV